MTRISDIMSGTALALLAGAAVSCNNDTFSDPPLTGSAANPTLAVTIGYEGAPAAREQQPGKPGYELGEGLENFLDIDRDNYRIYFFSADKEGGKNTYISTFRPFAKPTVSSTENVDGVRTLYLYSFLGEVPADMPMKFKMVTLANWDSYPAEDAADGYALVKGVTTISDICRHAEAQFAHITPEGDSWLDSETGKLIPFYGVREYDLKADYVEASAIETGSDGTEHIKGDLYIDLKTDKAGNATALPLLRGMAKVEVILENPFADFESVTIHNVNDRGFNAPGNAFSHSDYDHSYTWDLDFIRGVHLPGGDNDPLASPLAMTRTADADGGKAVKRWIAYVPEYQNVGKENFSYITVKLAKPEGMTDTEWEAVTGKLDSPDDLNKTIYFATGASRESNDSPDPATFNPDGTMTKGRFNIERNNIYRFTAKGMTADMDVDVDIQPYAECFLEYDLGFMRDEDGDLMVVPDSDGKMPEYFNMFMMIMGLPYPTEAGGKKLEPNWEIGDYYAIVTTTEGSNRKHEVWLKDSDGDKVLSNYGDSHTGGISCSTREVGRYEGKNLVTTFYKDSDGHRRMQHNEDHSSIAYDSDNILIFKSAPGAADPFSYIVESVDYNEKNPDGTSNPEYGNFWYVRFQSEPFISSGNEPLLKEILGKFGGLDETGGIPDHYMYLTQKRQIVTTDGNGDTVIEYEDRHAVVRGLQKAGISGEDYPGETAVIALEYIPQKKTTFESEPESTRRPPLPH